METGYVVLLLATSLVCCSDAFLPTNIGVMIPSTDYTLTDITELGIVRGVAKYFEDTNPDRYSPGELMNLTSLTASQLFQKHYGDSIYSAKFKRAISAITDENIQIANKFAGKAIWHFNGNYINKGNRKMKTLRSNLLTQLSKGDVNSPDYDTARLYCGQFLHMAHSFYSNTNWIELNRWLNSLTTKDPNEIITSSDLGIINLTFRQSPPNENMCKNCLHPSLDPACDKNLKPYVYYLTSGYRSSQDVPKPVAVPGSVWGKCSHGGINDASRTLVATGGINKETSDLTLSPHYHLHEQAALTAIQATQDFFYHPKTGLYQLIGEAKFRKLLNLDTGSSLTFVIDTTGSMSEEINAVKQQTISLVKLHRSTNQAASRYVVSPFSDPAFGPVFVTTDPDDCISYLGRLIATGGGDCPELANSGIELGVQNSLKGQKIYVFTDADDKDSDKLPDVRALIIEKKVQVKFLLTGSCGGRRKRATGDYSVSSSYTSIASVSGGEIYQTDNSGIQSLTRVIEGDIRASQVTITKRSLLNHTAVEVDIPIDSGTREIKVSVVGDLASDTVVVVNPTGFEGFPDAVGADIFTSSSSQIVFSINTTAMEAKGMWGLKLMNLDLTTEYRLTVEANSLLDFDYALLEVDKTGAASPIDGLPVAGSEVLVTIQVSAPEIVDSVSEIRLHDSTGEEKLVTVAPEPVTGRTAGLYVATVTLPNKPFFISIVGNDTESLAFLRTRPSNVQVVNFKLQQVLEANTLDDLVPGGSGNFSFLVTNFGPADNFTTSVSKLANSGDVSVLQVEVSPSVMMLETGMADEGTVSIITAEDAPVGTSVKVTLSVTSSSSVSNFLSVDTTVFAAENATEDDEGLDDDDNPPTCTIMDTGGGCTQDQMGPSCSSYTWWLRFRVTDDILLTEVATEPETGISDSQSLIYEYFSLVNIQAKYSASCCCPTVSIVVRDGARNNASCIQDYYTPVAGVIDRPTCMNEILTTTSPLTDDGDKTDDGDTTPPVCTILTSGGGCTSDQMGPNCHLNSWWMQFQVTDETDIQDVRLDPDVKSSLQTLEEEVSELNNITYKYQTTCCCPIISITAQDGAGNTASCKQDFYSPVAGQITQPVCNGPVNPTVMPNSPASDLSTGAIIGIVAGSAFGLIVLGGVLVAVFSKSVCVSAGKTSVTPANQAWNLEPLNYKK